MEEKLVMSLSVKEAIESRRATRKYTDQPVSDTTRCDDPSAGLRALAESCASLDPASRPATAEVVDALAQGA